MATTCPKCEQSDRITKVSAIVTGGISSGSYQGPSIGVSTPVGKGQSRVSGGYTTLQGSSQTMISGLLAPPKKPETKRWSGCAIFALIGLAPLTISAIVGYQDGGAAFGVIFVVIIIAIITSQNNKVNTSKEEYEKELPRWQQAMRRWDSLYYCERDDILFNPETNETLPVGAMMDYLYK